MRIGSRQRILQGSQPRYFPQPTGPAGDPSQGRLHGAQDICD